MTANSQSLSNTQDVPPVLALAGLCLVVGGLFYLDSPTTFSILFGRLDQYAERNLDFLTVVALATFVDTIWILSVASRLFGKQRQGSRLEAITGKQSAEDKAVAVPLLIALSFGVVAYGFLALLGIPETRTTPPIFVVPVLQTYVGRIIRVLFAGSVFVISQQIAQLGVWNKATNLVKRRLPAFPAPDNSVVLGSVDEEGENPRPKWMILGLQALHGNILISGSIGVGKTAGMVLAYLIQILTNFKPRAAMLLIDPKGTFIPRALKFLTDLNLMPHVLHLKTGGLVTMNPLYRNKPLKNSQFLETAQMVKAAAANALRGGSSKDSEFWDISAFNLIKNSLVYCYSVHGYTTLETLYKTMVLANSENYKPALSGCIGSEDFDEEEKFNIRCSMDYFESEYKQLDNKVRTSILATATSFLNQFQEYQANRLFCPKEEDLTVRSMDEVIDEGKILLFDVRNPVLARSMGTFVKLLFEQSVLNRLSDDSRPQERSVVIIADECQDIITSGSAAMIGDVTYLAKSREAKAIAIMATQSQTSIENALGSERAAAELIQNFRTRLSAHSGDLRTIRSFQGLVGQEERTRTSHSVSENSQHPNRNLLLGGYESANANISESISTSEFKEDIITGKEFSRLRSFECFGLIYDGIETHFKKLFLRPYFLEKKNISYQELLKWLRNPAPVVGLLMLLSPALSHAFPNVCTVVKSADFRSCLNFSVGSCMCGWPIPRPCANFSYYVPQTFLEVFPNPKSSYFGDLPGAATQLATLGKMPIPFGAEADDDTQSFQAHAIGVPFTTIPFSSLPCGGARMDQLCFDGMSEHLGSHWNTGSGDLLQPNFLAWGLNPKACLLKGAATSISGSSEPTTGGGGGCSVNMGWLSRFPPSGHSACTGWGTFYPRSGVYHGPSQTTGALMIAARMKSLGSEVFHTTPSSGDEIWQMISPQSSSCFREGQNIGILEITKNVRELGRVTSGKLTGYLFTVWSKVTCCRDLVEVPAAYIAIEAMSLACQGLGSI